jgi:hypothetical protein
MGILATIPIGRTEVPVGERTSAEEFYSRCLSDATVLEAAAHVRAEGGDAVGAMATAWGADVLTAQAVVWERILVASSFPQRQFFRVADALITGLHEADPPVVDQPTVRDVLMSSRGGLLAACEPALRQGVEAAWSEVTYLSDLAAPSFDDLEASVQERTGGLSVAAFLAKRRDEAAQAMNEAQALRIKGDTEGAIGRAYESDFLAMEAYFVESAIAAGDSMLVSVTIRWVLATDAMSHLASLPDGFVTAVASIRRALSAGLSDADAARLGRALLPV